MALKGMKQIESCRHRTIESALEEKEKDVMDVETRES